MKSCLDKEISCFANYNTPVNPQPVNLLQWLTSAKYAAQVEAIRQEPVKARRDAMKSRLPAITPSGTFTRRKESCLIQHSGFIQFDIDLKENLHIINYADLNTQLCNIQHVAYCGLSVSGTGFWGLIPIAYPERHKEHFEFMRQQFERWGIKIDPAPANIASLRGYGYDAGGFFRHDAEVLRNYCQPPQQPRRRKTYQSSGGHVQADVESLINQLTGNGIDITEGYKEKWLRVGYALAHQFGEAGRQYFHDVSSLHPKYNHRETEQQFTKCTHSTCSGKPVTISTFFALCKQAGVTLERKIKQAAPRKKMSENQNH